MKTDDETLAQRVQPVLERAVELARPCADWGEAASYIPALAKVPTDRFGMAVADLDGGEAVAGDGDVPFSVQSITKVFALTLAMQRGGLEIWDRVGREPSGDPFNSLVQLEYERGKPRNPFINAGAIVVTDLLIEHCGDAREDLLELMYDIVGEEVDVDDTVWESEKETGDRNRAMANLIASFGNLHNPVEVVLDRYFHQSALVMTPRQLARSMGFLANDGIDPRTGKKILSAQDARRVTALMLTCGTYDAAGEFAFEIGIPCKSGVGGGIVGVIPDQLGVCVWSPPLDQTGNSAGGRVALEQFVEDTNLSIF